MVKKMNSARLHASSCTIARPSCMHDMTATGLPLSVSGGHVWVPKMYFQQEEEEAEEAEDGEGK